MPTRTLIECSLLAVIATSPLFGQAVRDSGGMRIVDYGDRQAASPARLLTLRRVLSIGGSEGVGATEFSDVRGVTRLPDGRIAVANGATGEIRVFSPRGAFIRSYGRRGPGPGEFTRLSGLLRSGDTLIGVDRDGRAQAFVPDVGLTRSLMPLRPPAARNPQRFGVLPNGTVWVTMLEDPPTRPSIDHDVTLAVGANPAGTDSIVTVVRLKAHHVSNFSNRPARLLFDARGSVTMNNERLCAGYSDRFELTCYDLTGRPLLRIVRNVKRARVSENDLDQARAAYLAANRDAPPEIRRQMERAVLDLPFAELLPAFGRLLLTNTGDLWVSPFHAGNGLPGGPADYAPKAAQRWSIFARDGAWIADVELPGRFVLMEAEGDHVVGVEIDDDDTERIVVLSLRG